MSRKPFGARAPEAAKRSGWFRKSRTSANSATTSSTPPMSMNRVAGFSAAMPSPLAERRGARADAAGVDEEDRHDGQQRQDGHAEPGPDRYPGGGLDAHLHPGVEEPLGQHGAERRGVGRPGLRAVGPLDLDGAGFVVDDRAPHIAGVDGPVDLAEADLGRARRPRARRTGSRGRPRRPRHRRPGSRREPDPGSTSAASVKFRARRDRRLASTCQQGQADVSPDKRSGPSRAAASSGLRIGRFINVGDEAVRGTRVHWQCELAPAGEPTHTRSPICR